MFHCNVFTVLKQHILNNKNILKKNNTYRNLNKETVTKHTEHIEQLVTHFQKENISKKILSLRKNKKKKQKARPVLKLQGNFDFGTKKVQEKC